MQILHSGMGLCNIQGLKFWRVLDAFQHLKCVLEGTYSSDERPAGLCPISVNRHHLSKCEGLAPNIFDFNHNYALLSVIGRIEAYLSGDR